MDLIDEMIQRLKHIEPKLTDDRARVLEDALRDDMGGAFARVRKRRRTKADQITEMLAKGFDGDVERLAIRLGCHRSTVYRVLRARPKKHSQSGALNATRAHVKGEHVG